MSPEMQQHRDVFDSGLCHLLAADLPYVFSVRSRQKNLEKDIETLRLLVEKKQEGGNQ